MRRRFAVALFLLAASGCLPTSSKCGELNRCGSASGGSGGVEAGGAGAAGEQSGGAPTDGGQGGGGGEVVGCDETTGPDEDACVVTPDLGVFVSPDGDDDDVGTNSAPFATLSKAIEVAAKDGKRVYVCEGDYGEALRLDESAAGVAIFGGFDCQSWEYSTERKARISPNDPMAFVVRGANGLELHDIEVVAADATEWGENSIALFVSESDDVMLERVRLTAGDGRDGADGVSGGDLSIAFEAEWPDASEIDGSTGLGCLATSIVCPGGDSPGPGGSGGRPVAGGENGLSGGPDTLSGGEGGTVEECSGGQNGHNGATPTGDIDGTGATVHGTLTAEVWTSADGTDGRPGEPGQGGGGGASVDASGEGGGGGCGGCPGNGARGGKGGGSSIALLVFESATTVVESELVAADAGSGGDAAEGEDGQPGGLRGLPSGAACAGGNGGAGQAGGHSGAGAGGLSVGLLYSGTSPILDTTTEDAITIGTAGDGGAAVEGKSETGGASGERAAVMSVGT